MITARHDENGKVVITIDDWDDSGNRTKTDRHLDLQDALTFYNELGEALSECRRFSVNDAKEASLNIYSQNAEDAAYTQLNETKSEDVLPTGRRLIRSGLGDWKMRK